MKVRAHTCYLGKTGFAAHARSFFRELSKHVDLRVRNYTWCDTREYLNETDLAILDRITLTNHYGSRSDHNIKSRLPEHNWNCPVNEGWAQDVDIVLMDIDHHYFYDEYTAKIKIAYTVWESTLLPEGFFNQLKKFDYIWVVTEWHKEMLINQGYDPTRVFVVNEGVDEVFYADGVELSKLAEYEDDRFKFLFFGRWDYRKSVPEIIKAFTDEFGPDEKVDLILSADNPFSVDGMKSTEERLAHYGFTDPRIKVKHFVSRQDYITYMSQGHCFVSCARSEGWNIPLIEAMAAGTPAIYSDWGAQLEFAKGKGIPVKVLGEKPAAIGAKLGFAGNTPGNYAEPDTDDLRRALRDAFTNYVNHKAKAIKDSIEIAGKFNWAKVASDAKGHLDNLALNQVREKNGEAAVIMAHADTQEKNAILKRSATALIKQGYTVIVSSHIPVSHEIHDLVDFVVYDKDNPVVYRKDFDKYSVHFPTFYYNYPDYTITYGFDFNHGYAAYRLMKAGLGIASAYDFERIHFVNYDYVINNPKTLQSHSDKLNYLDLVSYYWGQDLNSFNSGFFSINRRSAELLFRRIYSIEDYFGVTKSVILENVLYVAAKDLEIPMDLSPASKLIDPNNSINAVILPTNCSVRIDDDPDTALVLGTDGTYKYLVFLNNRNFDYSLTIMYKEVAREIRSNGNLATFVRIPQSMIDDGFSVKVNPTGTIKRFDVNSNFANCQIRNISIVQEALKDVEVIDTVSVSFLEGPIVEIKGNSKCEYLIEFIDRMTDKIVFSSNIKSNQWTKCNRKYYTSWKVRISNLSTGEVREEVLNLNGRKVYISIDSGSLGDSIAWFAHIEEFAKAHECRIAVSTFKNELFEKNYPNFEFVVPGSRVDGVHACYRLGWYYNQDNSINLSMHPREVKTLPMQATTTDILGLEYSCVKPRIVINESARPIEEKYICIGVHATAKAKYWNNPHGWQEVADHYLNRGYKVVSISIEPDGYMGIKYPTGVIQLSTKRSLQETMSYLKYAEAFIGIGSGLSWLSWAIGTPTVLISGFSKPYSEMTDDSIIRIFKGGVCNGCFNRHRLDAGDWNWCPEQKGTTRQFECSKLISSSDVISAVDRFLETGKIQKSSEVIVDESYYLGMVQNHSEIIKASEFVRKLEIKNFMEIGTDQGGTFAIWSKVSTGEGIRISLDMPHGRFGRSDYNVNQRDQYLKSLGTNVTMIHGSSHDEEMKVTVNKILGDAQLDFLFIDGDHTYEGVKQDYEMYKEFVKPGGWIGFHDIQDTEFHRNANCRVDQLWSELEGTKVEFIDAASNFGGIGFIQVV
jgi:autotransporter strand-loop-strand O-heptosyltransferase